MLQLIACALSCKNRTHFPIMIDWQYVDTTARKHAIIPIIYHAASLLPTEERPSQELWNAWKSYTISSVMRNEKLLQAQAGIIALLQSSGIACAILKGASLAVRYPKLEMRALGDIDILVHEEQCSTAVSVLEANGYCKHNSDHAFHIGFNKAEIYLELHYALTRFPDLPIGKRICLLLQSAVNRTQLAAIDKNIFPVLNLTDQAISLLLHMERHMVGAGIGLRQLCDWCVFIRSLSQEDLLNQVIPAIIECKLFRFASILTMICVDYLGLDEPYSRWCCMVSKEIKDNVLADILDSGNMKSRDIERSASSVFVVGEESSTRKQSLLTSAVSNLTVRARKQFPICHKLPILLPMFWVYIPVRYLYRSMKGTRPKQSVRRIARYAVKRKKLYRELELFKR